MAVDWHIHVVAPPVDDATLKCFFSNHLGHPLFEDDYRCPDKPKMSSCHHSLQIMHTQAVEVGSKHWLTPWIKGEAPEDLCDPVEAVLNVFDDFDEVTPELIETIRLQYDVPSVDLYPMEGRLEYRERVVEFLTDHMGEKIFAVGW